jgi:hypothetical protein
VQEHPIPQDVTGYKFHIVGNMTLKQFAEVGAGVVVAIILYNTNLISVVKWPLIVLAVGLGGAMAFMPIEERPLDHWIITFFRRLYSPTKFYWRRENTVPFAMTPTKQTTSTAAPPVEVDLTPARRKRITEYLESVKRPPQLEEWETQENSRVSQILTTFGSVAVDAVESKPAKPEKPQLSPRVRALASSQKSAPQKQVVFQAQEMSIAEPTVSKPSSPESVIPSEPTPPLEPPVTQPLPQEKVAEAPLPTIPQTPSEVFAEPASLSPADPAQSELEELPIQPASTVLPASSAAPKKLSFPQKQLLPNTIVGMVLTMDEKLVDRAVVKIKNTNGRVIRALRTNLLGQFFATAPLPNGSYLVSAEKEGFSFPEQTVTLSGAVPDPLEIKAA